MQIGFHIELLTALLFISMLMIILISDIKYMLIPDKVLLFFLPLFITLRYINPLEPWWLPILGAIVPFIMIAVIIFVSRGGMGRSEEHTSELQSRGHLVCRLLLEKKK